MSIVLIVRRYLRVQAEIDKLRQLRRRAPRRPRQAGRNARRAIVARR